MLTKKELLRRTVEDLRNVPYNAFNYRTWTHFDNTETEGFSCTLSLMQATVYHSKEGGTVYLEVEDIENSEKAEYTGIPVRDLYHHLTALREGISAQSKPAERSTEESLLEKLMREANIK